MSETEINDPYAYLQRNGFSSEKFKIEIKNLPKIYGIQELRKLIKVKLKLNLTKIKLPKKNSPYLFVCFTDEEQRQRALQQIKGFKWKGKFLEAMVSKPSPDPLINKRVRESDTKLAQFDGKTSDEILKMSTIPLWNVPYEEQLKQKQSKISDVLIKFANTLKHNNPHLSNWIKNQKETNDGRICELLDIRHADVYNGYRNKCSFTIGINDENGLPTVGFRLGNYSEGTISVGQVDNLQHIPDAMKKFVSRFQEFIRNIHYMKVFDPITHEGNLRQLILRMSEPNNQLMMIVNIHPQQLDESVIGKFKQEMVDTFTATISNDYNLTSIFLQRTAKKVSGEVNIPAELVWGSKHLMLDLLGLSFKVSPDAFFQINTRGAEILYKSIIEFIQPCKDYTVLDICCGTGTIALCIAKYCSNVIGLEYLESAVSDAKENALLNNITNADFVVGKAEKSLRSICLSTSNKHIAIVDPPRAGLHQKAIQHLRSIETIEKLIYVTCNPEGAMKNFVDLCRPISKTLQSEAFVPVKAVGVDLFPHTNHCEAVILFQRVSNMDFT